MTKMYGGQIDRAARTAADMVTSYITQAQEAFLTGPISTMLYRTLTYITKYLILGKNLVVGD